jgi:serine/threonine protein kinase
VSAERYERLNAIFLSALEKSSADRDAFLEERCGADLELRREVEELLGHAGDEEDAFGESSLERKRRFITEAIDLNSSGSGELASSLPEPVRVGEYLVADKIGEGGSGIVFRARREGHEGEVALKVLRTPEASSKAQRRFRRECRILEELDHPGVVRILDWGIGEAYTSGESEVFLLPFLAMELVQGATVLDWIREADPSVQERVTLALAIAEAVQHAHDKGVLHRDLKPGNVLVTPEGHPKVLDFGAAVMRAIEEEESGTRLTGMGQIIGTMAYMAPEQVAGDSDLVEKRTDVYALGALLYEMISGQPPHELAELSLMASIRRVREEDPRAIRKITRRCPRGLATVIHRALSRRPNDRQSDLRRLADQLRPFAS